jgi:hypothetical protein
MNNNKADNSFPLAMNPPSGKMAVITTEFITLYNFITGHYVEKVIRFSEKKKQRIFGVPFIITRMKTG